ncbi:acyl-CoA desaturase [Fulvivirga maritima]|uniref:fatty acid desaturase family protein n=1 Tax=Fulvivirga maritima TaxID=2904247 RepID=UPI001F261150|nr:acyl-CoA desaturase [Fulvivirga maritima]UII26761.1 acyl-CoA desaturase [Fulvivirga maritima]
MTKNPKFSTDKNFEFSEQLKLRVNDYFKVNDLSKQGKGGMIFKAICMLILFLAPLILINTGIITSSLLLFVFYILSGLGMAGIGMGVMHDAIHGSFSKKKKVNQWMGYTMNLIGANASVWKIQHNVLHHTYTNISESDDDINTPIFLRFSPHSKKYWIHRFQHIYIWLFYGLSTISWITAKDFVRTSRYNKMGFFNGKKELKRTMLKISAWKLLYYSYTLILPLIMVPLAWWVILLAFLSMHFVTGLLISIVFQTAHIMPNNDYPLPNNKGLIDNNWSVHQLATTSNYSPRSKFFSWMIGGLNYQIEHHLFPNICHMHYRKLSGIVAATAKEYGIPYHSKKTFLSAIIAHIKMLRILGKMELKL